MSRFHNSRTWAGFLPGLLALVVTMTPPASAQLQAGSPWPRFHANSLNNGRASGRGAAIGQVSWIYYEPKAPGGYAGGIKGSPVISSDGSIYFGDIYHNFYAVNADGSLKWIYERNNFEDGFYGTAAIGKDGTVYVASTFGWLHALTPDARGVNLDGTPAPGVIWSVKPSSNFGYSSPAIASDGTIYLASDAGTDNHLFAIRSADGSTKWSFPMDAWIESSPAIGSDGTIYVSCGDGYLYAVNPDQTKKWAVYLIGPGVNYCSPAIAKDGTLYISTYGGYLFAIKPDGTVKWQYSDPENLSDMLATPALGADGTIYIGGEAGVFHAFNPDGSVKWRYRVDKEMQPIKGSAAIASDGTIYFGAEGNDYPFSTYSVLTALHPDGTVKWIVPTFSHPDGGPAIGADGTVYQGTDDQYLIALSVPKSNIPVTGYSSTTNREVGGTGLDSVVTIGSAAPKEGNFIKVKSSNSGVAFAAYPYAQTVWSGATSHYIAIGTNPVAHDTVVTLTASSGGVSKQFQLKVLAPTLGSITFTPATVVGGNPISGTVSINSPAPAAGLPIALHSSSTAVVVPTNVVIPGGATSIGFQATTLPVTVKKVVTVSATLNGRTVKNTVTLNH